jgi:hypothetical protein
MLAGIGMLHAFQTHTGFFARLADEKTDIIPNH